MKLNFDKVVKWSATLVLISGAVINSFGYYPQGPWMLVAGGVLWLITAIHMRDHALIITNLATIVAGTGPLIYKMLTRQ